MSRIRNTVSASAPVVEVSNESGAVTPATIAENWRQLRRGTDTFDAKLTLTFVQSPQRFAYFLRDESDMIKRDKSGKPLRDAQGRNQLKHGAQLEIAAACDFDPADRKNGTPEERAKRRAATVCSWYAVWREFGHVDPASLETDTVTAQKIILRIRRTDRNMVLDPAVRKWWEADRTPGKPRGGKAGRKPQTEAQMLAQIGRAVRTAKNRGLSDKAILDEVKRNLAA